MGYTVHNISSVPYQTICTMPNHTRECVPSTGQCTGVTRTRRASSSPGTFSLPPPYRGAFPSNIGSLRLEDAEEVQLTPLDSALMAEQAELVELVMAHGGVTIARIHNVAATRIQAREGQRGADQVLRPASGDTGFRRCSGSANACWSATSS